tara:strand:+ start:1049 stop:1312 length:264 start_codon:yes stop_codon:yes gene_type:complete
MTCPSCGQLIEYITNRKQRIRRMHFGFPAFPRKHNCFPKTLSPRKLKTSLKYTYKNQMKLTKSFEENTKFTKTVSWGENTEIYYSSL